MTELALEPYRISGYGAARAGFMLEALRVPPGDRLAALPGKRSGQHSIPVNDPIRLCFRWTSADAYDVEICD